MQSVKAIVFDFGNVIIDINVSLTLEAFSNLTFKTTDRIEQLFKDAEVFRKYETGFYTDNEFRDTIRQVLSYPLNDREIDEAWNSLLLDVDSRKINFIERLKYEYPVYLLSNTNPIHIQKCKEYFQRKFNITDFTQIFNKVFLSYEMGLWKPDYQIYQAVLTDLKLKPEEVLFLDDNTENIQAAEDMGIQTIKINPPESFVPLLKSLI